MFALSDHFSLEEATASETASRMGIDNAHPEQLVIDAAVKTAVKMEKIRYILGYPIIVNSWIRCPALNQALGSKSTSQHIKGEAVDFICPPFGTPLEIARTLISNQLVLRYDHLILEHTWIHISFNSIPNVVQRGEVLSLIKDGHYSVGLTDMNGNKL